MIPSALIVASTLLLAAPDIEWTWSAPSTFLPGGDFPVELTLVVPESGEVPAWWLSPAAFSIDGAAVAARGGQTIAMAPGAELTLRYDLGGALGERETGFALQCDAVTVPKPLEIDVLRPVRGDVDFMTIPEEQLAGYRVLLQTNQGDMLFDVWPDVAPGHVRNFLDLSHTGFYDGIQFHRVSPTFMIQGGCPNTKDPTKPQATWGTGDGPRRLDAEFSDKRHERGVLSMARSNDPNSASSQFFVITQAALFLDGQYSAFGQMVTGDEALSAIANAQGLRNRDGTVRPNSPQRIDRAVVVIKGDSE